MHEVIGEVDNNDRALMAKSAVQEFANAYYHSASDQNLDDAEVRSMVAGDFIGDLIHWLGLDEFELLVQRGLTYYDEEMEEGRPEEDRTVNEFNQP